MNTLFFASWRLVGEVVVMLPAYLTSAHRYKWSVTSLGYFWPSRETIWEGGKTNL
jgi:hypothetical protein